MAFQDLANLVVRGLLRTPLLCRIVGARLITIYVVGRKSGRHYAVPSPIPVMMALCWSARRSGGDVTCAPARRWTYA